MHSWIAEYLFKRAKRKKKKKKMYYSNLNIYHVSQQNFCHSSPCPGENFICQVGFTAKHYRCVCVDGLKGEKYDKGMPPHVDFVISMLCVSTLISGQLFFQTCSFTLRHKFTVNVMIIG